MDTDSPHGWTHAVTRFHVDMPPLMVLDTQAGTLTEGDCRLSWQCHKSSLFDDTCLFRQTMKLVLFVFTAGLYKISRKPDHSGLHINGIMSQVGQNFIEHALMAISSKT